MSEQLYRESPYGEHHEDAKRIYVVKVEPPDDMKGAVLCWVDVPPTEFEILHRFIVPLGADDE